MTAASTAVDSRETRRASLVIGFTALMFVALMFMDNQALLAPLWTALAFPAFAIAPFMLLNLKVPGRVKTLVILILILIAIPMLGIRNNYYMTLATQIGLFAAMALGLNIVVGFAGLLDLGYVAFFAVGAYLWAVFSSNSVQTKNIIQTLGMTAPDYMFYPFLILAILAAAGAGILLGLPVLRLRGDYLAIVTLGFGEVIRVLFKNLDKPINITNGSLGLDGLGQPPLPQVVFDLTNWMTTTFGLQSSPRALAYNLFFYLLVILICGLAVILASRLDNSPIGRAWTAIREDETAAIAMGVPLVRMKLMAFATGAAFSGAMGVIWASRFRSVTPDTFDFNQSIFILAIVIVGGMGSIRGVILGAIVVSLLNFQVLQSFSDLITNLKNQDIVIPIINFSFKNWPNQLEIAKYQRFLYGILLILIVLFRPAGILPATRRKLELSAESTNNEPPPEDQDPTGLEPGKVTNAA